MKRQWWLLLIILSVAVTADEVLDFTAWKHAVINGQTEHIKTVIDSAVAAGGCKSGNDLCLRLPGQTRMCSPAFLRATATRVMDWTTQTKAVCSESASKSDAARTIQACINQRAKAFSEGLAGEEWGGLLSDLPPAIAQRLISELVLKENPDQTPAPTPPPKEFSQEAKTIGRQICDLTERLHENQHLLEQVQRRGSQYAMEKQRRINELTAAVKELSDTLVQLKKHFTTITGEQFDPYVFCGPPTDIIPKN